MVVVTIYSSGYHYGPLKPTPKLRYDLRGLTNPPKHLRYMDGRSKQLRDHLMNDTSFIDLLHKIQEDILQEISELPSSSNLEDHNVGHSETNTVSQQMNEVEISKRSEPDFLEKPGDSETRNYPKEEAECDDLECDAPDKEDEPEIKVNCFCHLGRHRSASIVEELARLKWSKGVHIDIIHRDIDRDRRKPGKTQWVRKSKAPLDDEGY